MKEMKTNVLITGASRGLGYYLGVCYLEKGCRVFMCMRNIECDAAKNLKARFGEDVQMVEMDVADSLSVANAAASLKKTAGTLDIIISNAGIHSESSLNYLEDINIEQCLDTYNVNTLGPLRVAKELSGLLEGGSLKLLVNISSEAGSISACKRSREFDYCMSKAALNMESVILQNYLRGKGVKVMALHPGWVRTDMGGQKADFAPETAASNVAEVIENNAKTLDGPVYLNYDSKKLEF